MPERPESQDPGSSVFDVVAEHLRSAGRESSFKVKVFDGRPVVAFEVVDTWHQSAIGRAWAWYDDFCVYFDGLDVLEWGGERYLTEVGYAKLAPKCFDDDLSWKLQNELVRRAGGESLAAEPRPHGAGPAAMHSEPTPCAKRPDVPDSLPEDIDVF